METFGEWLKAELKRKNISQKELADISGVTPAQISRIISGTRGAGDQALNAIAHALHLSPKLVFEKAGLLSPSADDPWAEQMNHKISQLTGARREMAERLLNTLLDEQDRETRQGSTRPAKP
jgi:transcriptional regulator with XRE-family HTH domain